MPPIITPLIADLRLKKQHKMVLVKREGERKTHREREREGERERIGKSHECQRAERERRERDETR